MLQNSVSFLELEELVLGLSYTLVVLVAELFSVHRPDRERMRTLLAGLVGCIGLLSENLVVVIAALGISALLPVIAGRRERLGVRLWYSAPLCLLLAGGSWLLYQDLGGFAFGPQVHLRGETLAVFCLAALFRSGVVPCHGFLLQGLQTDGFSTLVALFNPLGLYLPLLLISKAAMISETDGYAIGLLIFGLTLSCYFALASFSEKSFAHFIYYVFSSLSSLTIAGLPLLGAELSIAAAYFYASTMVASLGLVLCLGLLHCRYGCQRISGKMGLFHANPWIGVLFIFFLFCLGNMPLTLSFLGEDVMLFPMFRYNFAAGFFALAALGLVAVSLYRFYTQVFGGPWPNYPILPLLMHERLALGLLFATGLLMPIFAFL